MPQQRDYIELSALQNIIKGRIGFIEQWVKAEIESHRVVGGHHYINLIEKTPGGEIAAKASARIWRSKEAIVSRFTAETGKSLETGLSLVVKVQVEYHPQYGLSLTITDIDSGYTIGQRELQRRETIRLLTESGKMELQKSLSLPFLPEKIAVISSADAAGYGDFVKHLGSNPEGYQFDYTLFQSLVQGDNAPSSIISAMKAIKADASFDLILILRGGGAESDLFCYDDLSLCMEIAGCPVPVFTAIGHERDYHIADMVAFEHFKTPTALADALIGWVQSVEDEVNEALDSISRSLRDRVNEAGAAVERAVKSIQLSMSAVLTIEEGRIALLESGILSSDPRAILKLGYVLAQDKDGTLLRDVRSKKPGDEFYLRFNDGLWNCGINDVKIYDKSGLQEQSQAPEGN